MDAPVGFPRAAAAKMLKSSLKATSVVRVIADPGKARKIKGLEVLDGQGLLAGAAARRALRGACARRFSR